MQDDAILLINVDHILTLKQDSCSIIFLYFSHTSHQRHQRTLNAAAVPATVLRRFEDDLPSWKPHRRHRAIGCSSCSSCLIIFLSYSLLSYHILIHVLSMRSSSPFLQVFFWRHDVQWYSDIFQSKFSVQVGSTSWLSTCQHETRPCSWVRQASSCWRPALGRLLGLPRTAMLPNLKPPNKLMMTYDSHMMAAYIAYICRILLNPTQMHQTRRCHPMAVKIRVPFSFLESPHPEAPSVQGLRKCWCP